MKAGTDTVVSVIGARPHFTKAAPLIRALAGRRTRHLIVHTGQHYSDNMSKVFFDELGIPAPDINLGVGSGTHAEQTAAVMVGVERYLLGIKPKAVVVYGDTNSTLGAALAAAKAYHALVHVEAGVRCANRRMPEEINRVLVDHASDFLICPSRLAVQNLEAEGVTKGVLEAGDLMYDSFIDARDSALRREGVLGSYGLRAKEFTLCTIHREASTAQPGAIQRVLEALGALGEPVILPMHPRTRKCLRDSGFSPKPNTALRIIEPLGYPDLLHLILHARRVITDSGGVQKEAYWAGVPCITLMDETAWAETTHDGWNVLVGLDCDRLRAAAMAPCPSGPRPEVYGAPGAARRMVEMLGWA